MFKGKGLLPCRVWRLEPWVGRRRDEYLKRNLGGGGGASAELKVLRAGKKLSKVKMSRRS